MPPDKLEQNPAAISGLFTDITFPWDKYVNLLLTAMNPKMSHQTTVKCRAPDCVKVLTFLKMLLKLK